MATQTDRERDVTAKKAARKLGLSEAAFLDALDDLIKRGFPQADPTTGRYDLKAIEAWQDARFPHLFLTSPHQARDAKSVVPERLKRGEAWAK